MNTIDVRPLGIDLDKDIGRNKRLDQAFVPGFPEIESCLHKIYDQIAAFNVTLLS